jgi:hypothetical protein
LTKTIRIKSKANIALALPQSSKSGTRINSSVFIIAIMRIWTQAFSLDLIPLKIQIAIKISEIPMAIVNSLECSVCRIFDTICWCLGTRLSTLQNRPFTIQIIDMQ